MTTVVVLLCAGFARAQAIAMPDNLPPEVKALLEAKMKAAMEGKSEPGKGPEADKGKDNKDQPKKDDKDKSSKPDEGPKPVQRPTKPPAPPNPDEFKQARPDKSGKVTFNFNGQPWPDVMQWLAEVSHMSLDWQELPGDFLNLTTQRSYTLEEVRELIQRHLLARGYTLLVQGEVLSVVNLKKLDPALVPRVEPAQLERRSPYEFVKVSFTLDSLAADAAAEELKPMLSPYGKLAPLAATNRIEAIDAVANLREIAQLLREEQSPDSQGRLVREFVLKHARASEVVEQLQTLLGMEGKKSSSGSPGSGGPPGQPSPEQIQQMMQAQMQAQQQGQAGKGPPPAAKPKTDVSLVANRRRNSVLVRAPADKMAIVEQAIKTLDVSTADGQALAGALARTQVYRLAAIDPEPLVRTLEEIGNLDPATRLQVDKPNRSIIAFAPLADQVTIRALIDKLDGSGRRFEVLQLRRLAADYVAGTLDFLVTGGKKEQPQRRSWWDSPWHGGRNQSEEKPAEFRVDADVEHNRLLLWANDIEIAEVQKLLVKLGELPGEKGSAGTVRVLDARDDPQTREWLERVRRAWPGVAPNPLVLPPAEPAPPTKEKPRETPPAKPQNPQTSVPPALGEAITLEGPASAYVRFAQLQTAPAEKSPAAPPVTISRGPDGQLILSCPDPQALDRLEELMTQLSPPPRMDYKIYRLKYAYATSVATILRDAFKEDEKPARRNSFFFWDDFPPRDESDNKVTRLSKRRPLRIIADADSNSIMVQGADATQSAKVEELLEFYDRPEPTDARSMRRTALIQLHYAKAKTALEMVKDVYRDLLSANDKALQGDQKRPERTYNYIFDSSGDSGEQQKTPRFKGLLSLGVDELSNALIVSAPVFLFEDIERLVNQIDQAAEPVHERVEVVKLAPGASGSQMRRAIHRVFGDGSDLPPSPAKKDGQTATPPQKSTKGKTGHSDSSGQRSGEHQNDSSHSDNK